MGMFSIVIILLLFGGRLSAQEIAVTPGYGTLNDAIAANGGNKTYKLQAGGWYGLNAMLQTTEPIKIIGEKPAPGQMPAIIQTGTNSDGSTFHHMFEIGADFTIKHVFLVNADLNNTVGTWMFKQIANARFVADSIVADPVGWQSFLVANADKKETYVTNSILMRHGNTISSIDGWLFHGEGQRAQDWDTLYVENNTIVNTGLFVVMIDNYTQGVNNFIWFNHNTMLFQKGEIKFSYITNSDFFTNNLLWQGCFTPFLHAWNDTRVDAGPKNTISSIVCADTLNGETLPSQRKEFIEYNFNSIDPRVNGVIKMASDSGLVAYLRPFVWPPAMKDSSRETRMFNDKTNFPYFKAGNNIEYIPNDPPYLVGGPFIDPQFADQKIYAFTDSMVSWVYSAEKQNFGFPPNSYPPPADWTNFLYTRDPNNEGNPTSWPRIDCSYSNPQLLTASIERLPLGDLNWFPDKKAIWEKHKSEIMQHILSEDESQMSITPIEGMVEKDNGIVHIKLDLNHGGAISYISVSNSTNNLVNTADNGRYIQQSYTAGQPVNRTAEGQSPHASPWPWNPNQAGDINNNSSVVLDTSTSSGVLYTKTQPLLYDMNNDTAQCYMEEWVTLDSNVIHVRNKLTVFRTDNIWNVLPRWQELPHMFLINDLKNQYAYTGDKPWTNAPVTKILSSGTAWDIYNATEHWGAVVDNNSWGIGIYNKDCTAFSGGNAPAVGLTRLSPMNIALLDKSSTYEYEYDIILGTLDQIRQFAYRTAGASSDTALATEWDYKASMEGWYAANNVSGAILNNALALNVTGGDPYINSPYGLNVDAGKYKYIRLTMKNNTSDTTAKFYWITNSDIQFDESRSVTFTITSNDTGFGEYTIDLSKNSTWSGRIEQLRFDPVNNVSSGTVDIKQIKLLTSATSVDN